MPLPTLLQKNTLISRMGETKKEIENKRSLDFILEWFNDRIPDKFNKSKVSINTISDKVVILKSKTGSGKSTALPSELFINFSKRIKKTILISEPKVITAIEITKDINNIPSYKNGDRSIELYKNLGYQTGPFTSKPIERGILFTSIGVILQFLNFLTSEEFIKKYGIIIIDEVHERSIEVDIVLFYLKKIINDNLKDAPFLVLMSATMDECKFSKYFKTKTVFEVIGISFPIETRYLKYDIENYFQYTHDLIKEIHINYEMDFLDNDNKINYYSNSDIIIFLPSLSSIKKMSKLIEELNNNLKYKLLIIEISSFDINNITASYKNLFQSLTKHENKPVRRIILATNAVETGLTLESLKYCIDSGYYISVIYNPSLNSNVISTSPVTQNMSLQRKGRVGRKQVGIFYPLYTEETYNLLQVNTYPKIFQEEITLYLLNIIIEQENKFNLNKLNLLDEIPNDSIKYSINKLFILGFIDKKITPTKLGLIANMFRKIKIEDIKLILTGFVYNVNINDLITIISYLNIGKQSITLKGFKDFPINILNSKSKDNELIKLLISCEFINFILFYNNFIKIITKKKNSIKAIRKLCNDNFINFDGLMKLQLLKDELIDNFSINIGLNPYDNIDKDINKIIYIKDNTITSEGINYIYDIKRCIYEGYKLNIAVLVNDDYIIHSNKMKINFIYNSLFSLIKKYNINKPQTVIFSSSISKINLYTSKYEIQSSDIISVIPNNIKDIYLFSQ